MDSIEEKIEKYAEWMDNIHQSAIDVVECLNENHRAMFEAGVEDAELQRIARIFYDAQRSIIEAEEHIRQRMFAVISGYQQYGEEYPNPLPDGCDVVYDETSGGYRLVFPLWLFGFGPENNPGVNPYANLRGGSMLIATFWYKLTKKLVAEKLPSNYPTARRLDPAHRRARLTAVYHARRERLRDLDHYSVSPLVNGLVSTGLLLADGPEDLEYVMRGYVFDSTEDMPKWQRRGFVEVEICYRVE